MKTEYVLTGESFYDKRAKIYTDQIRDDGTIFYGPAKKFVPYFYVLEDSIIPHDDKRIIATEPGHKSIFGENLIKIYTKLPTDVPALRGMFRKSYEADILFPWRYRIDCGYVNKDNNRFFMDIEVAMGTRFFKGQFNHPIICITAYDTNSKQYHTFVWRGDLKKVVENMIVKERICEKKNANADINIILHKFGNENDMLNAFCLYFVGVNPDVVTSWNTSFDYPYLINRMNALHLDPSVLSPIRYVGVDKFDGEAIIKGRYVLDLLQAYKKIHIGQLESFKLDDVGLFEFGVPKIKFNETFEELWKQRLQVLIEYNIADLEICIQLDEKKKILDFFEGISSFTGAPLDETLANSRVLDFYFLKEAYKRKIRMPSSDKDSLPPDFEGAIVKEPIKGLHRNVICLDLASLYPSIILAGNMSLETIDSGGDIKFGNGVSFRSEPLGFIPSLIQDFLDRRKLIKKDMLDEFGKNGKTNKYEVLDAQQNVTKFLTNSIYGVLGFFRSRYFLEDVAKTITWVGREINLHTQRIVEQNGYTVITGDTDSVYVKLPDEYDLEKIVEVGKELQTKINDSYQGFSTNFGIKDMTFDIKFEKVYSVMIACKKKRYIGLLKWKEGKTYDEEKYGQLIDIVGFETRRSDTSKFTKEFLKVLYKMLLNETPKLEVYKFIRTKMDEYRRAPLDDIASPRSFTKKFGDYLGSSANSVFIKSAEWSNINLGYDIGEGSKCLFLYVKNTPSGGVCYMRGDEDKLEVHGIRVDYDMMVQRGILMKLDTLFEALGFSVDEMTSGQEQTKLEQWF